MQTTYFCEVILYKLYLVRQVIKIYASGLVIFGLDNGLVPNTHQTIIKTNQIIISKSHNNVHSKFSGKKTCIARKT